MVRCAALRKLVLAVVLLSAPALGQVAPSAPETLAIGNWKLRPSVELRARGEYLRDPVEVGGDASARVRNAGGVSERARLGLSVERDALRGQVTLQDARAWGTSPLAGSPGFEGLGAFGAYEAFAEVHTDKARPAYVRIGRQAVAWGDGRLLGHADFAPWGRSLDAVRAELPLGTLSFEVLAAMLRSSRPLGSPFGDLGGPAHSGSQLYGARVGLEIDRTWLNFDLYSLLRVARESAPLAPARSLEAARARGETATMGLRLHGSGDFWRWAVEGALQVGDAPSVGRGRAAHAFSAYYQRSLDRVVWMPELTVGAAYASGDSGSGSYGGFDPILPDVRRWNGAMDLFSFSNTMQAHGDVVAKPSDALSLQLGYRYARLAEGGGAWHTGYLTTVGQISGNTETELGHEFDASIRFLPWAPFDVLVGYSLFVQGEGAKRVLAAAGRGASNADGSVTPIGVTHWAMAQVRLRVP